MNRILIVGAGHAAAQLCASLREAGHDGPIVLIGEEAHLPYHRPPLSKTFVKDPAAELPLIRAALWYENQHVDLRLGERVESIDRAAHQLRLHSGETLDYQVLILATGARARRMPAVDAAVNAIRLRDANDAGRLREAIAGVQSVTVIGGGFIGLEFAATAQLMGRQARVIEMAPRLLARAVSPALSEHLLLRHRAAGMQIDLNARIDAIDVAGDTVRTITVNGQTTAVELLVVGIGAEPNIELAEQAGLACDNGIVVDAQMRTDDPSIFAVGDCVSFPRGGARMRLESVQNANDQARTAAAVIMGGAEPYAATPWFWSEQGGMRLQMAGLVPPDSAGMRRPGKTDEQFSILHCDGTGQLIAVESVNAPADHMMARKLVAAGVHPDPAQAVDPSVALKSLLPG